MKEIYELFKTHNTKVDKDESSQLRYRTPVTSLEMTPSETYYMHDPN